MRGSTLAVAVLLLLTMLATVPTRTVAQRSAGDDANIDPLFLIDMPVAGLLPTTAGSAEMFLYPEGGVLGGVVYGIVRNVNVGVFFGGTQLIGTGNITWDPLPGILVRYRIFEENDKYPALVAGFDSQGRDGWIPSCKQYTIKGPGIFLAASKNYALYGNISFHGGVNYTIERSDKDYSPNIWAGVEKTIGPRISVLGEYNFAFDNDKEQKGFWNGSLSAGVRVSTNIGLNIDVFLKNLTSSPLHYNHMVRSLRVQYVRYL